MFSRRLILLMFLVYGNIGHAQISKQYILDAIRAAEEKYKIPEGLLLSICKTESHLRADAYNHNDGAVDNHAFGICQVLYRTAKGMGLKDPNCEGDFSSENVERNYKTCKLFGPKTNAMYAARFLAEKIKRYKGDLIKAVAAYNAGSHRLCTKGFYIRNSGEEIPCSVGLPINWDYVKKILSKMGEL